MAEVVIVAPQLFVIVYTKLYHCYFKEGICPISKVTHSAVDTVAVIDCTNKQRTQTVYEPFYCSCELCMTPKDISVPLRRALTPAHRHLPVFCWKGGVIHRGRWQNIHWVFHCGCFRTLLSLFPCVFVSTHYIITSLPCCVNVGRSRKRPTTPAETFSAFASISMLAFHDVKAQSMRLALHFVVCSVVYTPAS